MAMVSVSCQVYWASFCLFVSCAVLMAISLSTICWSCAAAGAVVSKAVVKVAAKARAARLNPGNLLLISVLFSKFETLHLQKNSLRLHYWRNLVAAVEHRLRRPIDSNGEAKRAAGRSRQPVGFLVRAGRTRLQVHIERAIRVVLHRHPGGQVIAVDGIGHVVALRVVHGQRPRGVGGRYLALAEVDDVAAGGVQGVVIAVVKGGWVNHVHGEDSAQADQSDAGACLVIGSIVGEVF